MPLPKDMTWQQYLGDQVGALDRMQSAVSAIGQFSDLVNVADVQRQVVKAVLPQIISNLNDLFNEMG